MAKVSLPEDEAMRYARLAGLDRDEAQRWWALGIGAVEAWRAADAGVDDPLQWRDHLDAEWLAAGFTREEIEPWRTMSLSASEAAAWRDSGVSRPEVAGWRALKVLPGQAGVWTGQKVSADAVRALMDSGVDIKDVAILIEHSVDLGEWVAAGVKPKYVARLLATGLNPDEAAEWLDEGFSVPSISGLWRDRVPLAETRKWLDAGVPHRYVSGWIKTGLSFEKAAPWLRLGLLRQDAMVLYERGIDPEVAGVWLKSGYSFADSALLIDAEVPPPGTTDPGSYVIAEWREGSVSERSVLSLTGLRALVGTDALLESATTVRGEIEDTLAIVEAFGPSGQLEDGVMIDNEELRWITSPSGDGTLIPSDISDAVVHLWTSASWYPGGPVQFDQEEGIYSIGDRLFVNTRGDSENDVIFVGRFDPPQTGLSEAVALSSFWREQSPGEFSCELDEWEEGSP